MVESSAGGSCRCQEGEFRGEEGGQCCGPQVFTSVLLGVLACVLMTGGVFLAFHRWDPLWLIVSGIGVVLVLIGSVLHCCSSAESGRGRSPGGGVGGAKGGCCCPPAGPHLHGHLVANNGSLTEQLLPLSNARSVSQLSLNMLPGYFPPVVTTYGIEQHSAAVQNISRLQQLQLQQQGPPSAATSGAGKSFILLSLAGGDAAATQANVQNLVATVYQLEGSTATESPPPAEASANDPLPAASSATSPTATTPVPSSPRPAPVLYKSVEVQTCNAWPANNNNNNVASSNTASASTSTETEDPRPSTSAVTTTSPVDLMDCDIPPPPRICDSAARTCSSDQTVSLTNIPATPSSSSSVLVDVPAATPSSSSSVLVDVPATSSVLVDVLATSSSSSSSVLVDVPATSSSSSSVLVDVSESADENLLDLAPPPEVPIEEGTRSVDAPRTSSDDVLIDISDSSGTISSEPSEVAASITPSSDSTCNLEEVANGDLPSSNRLQQVGVASSELSLGNLSDFDGEVDDSELIGRSSPPPSYDDATHEGENAIGAFGLAYGTI